MAALILLNRTGNIKVQIWGEGVACVCVFERVCLAATKVQRGYFLFYILHKIWPYAVTKRIFFFLFHMNWLSVTACRKRIQMASAVRFSIMSALAEDTFIFSQTFYLITVPSGLLVLPLPVCFRGNPSFVSQGSSANSENLKLSSELKQLERIWLRRVTARCISQHSRLVITSARETTHCKSSTVKQFPELSITVPELCCNTETQGALGIAL